MEIQLKETDGGELYFNIPDDVLNRLGWKEGDDLKFEERNNSVFIKKIKYETIELEFSDEELLRYMQCAHEENITFNEFCERAIKAQIHEVDSE
ncbi:MAG: AbrB/MazE/SpoVT family DNA-binding domain-containing protein [Flavobacteriia bacterium]|nr:AbrB/MazE/SpoVT family DNA-binding domain-containing protein [Flavobacteriia bacterium]